MKRKKLNIKRVLNINNKFILIGADPANNLTNPGGQLTACIGLIQYAAKQDFFLQIIDTFSHAFPVPPLYKRLKKGFKRIIDLYRLLKKKDIKGVIIFSGTIGLGFYERILMSLICRWYNIKHIFCLRDSLILAGVVQSRVLRFFNQILLKIPSLVIVQGNILYDFYLQHGIDKSKLIVIRNWLPPGYLVVDEPKYVPKGGIIKFIFVGWLIEEKGILNLLYAIEKLLEYYTFECIIIGGGTLEEEVKNKINNFGMRSKVYATGWLSKEAIQNELEKAHVLVLPSKTEGFPNVIIEAMAYGLPIIATKVGGIPDSVYDGDNGYLIESSQPEQIMNAMKKYILDPSLVLKHSLKSLDIVKTNHNAETNCSAIFKIFSDN